LTRSDAAKLIWTCWRYRELQKKSRRPMETQRLQHASVRCDILLGSYYWASTAGRGLELSPRHHQSRRWVARMSTWSADATTVRSRAARRRTSGSRRSPSPRACSPTCGVGTELIRGETLR
jgi:hypothetical protein